MLSSKGFIASRAKLCTMWKDERPGSAIARLLAQDCCAFSVCVQPFVSPWTLTTATAMSARMVKFGEDEVCIRDSDSDYDDGSFMGFTFPFTFPDPVPRHQISTVRLDEQGVHGHSLSGEVLFKIQRSRLQAEPLTAEMLLERISEETGCFSKMAANYQCLTLSVEKEF